MEVDTADFIDGVVFVVNLADSRCGRDEQAEWGLAGAVTGGRYSARRSGVAGGKAGLIGAESLGGSSSCIAGSRERPFARRIFSMRCAVRRAMSATSARVGVGRV